MCASVPKVHGGYLQGYFGPSSRPRPWSRKRARVRGAWRSGFEPVPGRVVRPGEGNPEISEKERRRRFEEIISSDDDLMHLLQALRGIGLPQWRLVAGCLYQTVWNVLSGRPCRWGIHDYDVIYFDDHDLSWNAEDEVIRRVTAATADCVGPVQVRNQARVHLWFERRFGVRYPPLKCGDESLGLYASVVHAIGIRLEQDDRLDIAAPFGLEDLFAMVIRPNRALDNAASHARKAAKEQAMWPEVTVVPWRRSPAAKRLTATRSP